MIRSRHDVSDLRFVPDRLAFLVERARGRDVLHVGCVDAGLTDEHETEGRFLHHHLVESARHVTGLDLDAPGLEALRRRGVANLVHGDIEGDLDLGRRFDLVVAGELIEHLSNPGRFLDRVPPLLAEGGQLVLTTPNASGLFPMRSLLRNVETVHEDHVAWYSPTTLARLLSRHGLRVVERLAYSEVATLSGPRRWLKQAVIRLLLCRRPGFCEGLIVVAVPDQPAASSRYIPS